MASELTLSGNLYSVSKIPSAIKQMQIARRVLPILASGEKTEKAIQVESIFNKIGGLKDEDFEYILIGLLGGVKRKDGGGAGVWTDVVVNGVIAYQDINMLDLLQLAQASAKENLDFLGNVGDLTFGTTKQG
jgi:hypothetical protein